MNEKKMSSHAWYKIFVYVTMIVFAINIIVPVAQVFLSSVRSQPDLVGDPWSMPTQFLWNNFVDAMEKTRMGEYFISSIFVTMLGLVFLLMLASPASYVLARYPFRDEKPFNTLLMAGLFISVNYIVLPIYLMLFQTGQSLGVEMFPNNKVMLALVNAATNLLFTIYLLSGYFKILPKAYKEVALIDDCSYFKIMTRIMIPIARPSIITVILLQFLAFWNGYIMAFTLMDKNNATLAVKLKSLMADQRSQANYGAMYAGPVIVMVPTLILYIYVQKKLTQSMNLRDLKD